VPELWGEENFQLLTGVVPLGNDIFRRIVIRATRVPQIDARDFSLRGWTERPYYELCTSAEIYSGLEKKSAKAN
jgi:hypothetical protein